MGKGKGKTNKSNPHAHLKCDFCGRMGHIKKNCYKHHRLQNSSAYQSARSSQPQQVQVCLELLENACERNVCPQCYQDYCDGYACEPPPFSTTDMDTASSFFFDNSCMYDEVVAAKWSSRFEPFSRDVYFAARNGDEGADRDEHHNESTEESPREDEQNSSASDPEEDSDPESTGSGE